MSWLDTADVDTYYFKYRNHANDGWTTLFEYDVETKALKVGYFYTKTEVGTLLAQLEEEIVIGLTYKADKETTYSIDQVDALLASVGNNIEQTTSPVVGLIWNQTDDAYKRISKNIDFTTIDGTGEFSAWLSPTATRQNDNDTVSISPFTKWLNNSVNLPYGAIGRYVVNSSGAEVKAYNADSYAHTDQTGILSTQQVMVKIPKFYTIQAKVVDKGKTYHIYAISKENFTLDLISELGFIAPVATCWNPTTGVSSGTLAESVITSAIHPAFMDNSGGTLSQRYYGAFNGISGRSICSNSVYATGGITRAEARTSAQAFGSGFAIVDFFLRSALDILTLVERGTFYFDTGKWRGYDWNTSASANDQYNGLTLSLLNRTGVILDSSSRVIANSYRGIENYHSALWNFVDGVNSNNYSIFLAKPKSTFTDDTTASPYFDSGYDVTSGASSTYISDFSAGSFIPSAVGATGTTKAMDGCWSATGSTVLIVGGALNNGALSGLSTWFSVNASSNAGWNIVGRPGL